MRAKDHRLFILIAHKSVRSENTITWIMFLSKLCGFLALQVYFFCVSVQYLLTVYQCYIPINTLLLFIYLFIYPFICVCSYLHYSVQSDLN